MTLSTIRKLTKIAFEKYESCLLDHSETKWVYVISQTNYHYEYVELISYSPAAAELIYPISKIAYGGMIFKECTGMTVVCVEVP